MASLAPTEAVCPACNNTGYVAESEDEVTGCVDPGCPYWAEHDAKQGRIVIDITPRRTDDDHPMRRLGLTEDQWFDLCHNAWERSDGTQYIPGR